MILDNCTVITMDGERRVITEAAIVIEGTSIAAVGKSEGVRAEFGGHEIRDLNGWIVLPGLIDGHMHLPQMLLRGAADELPLHRWMAERIFVLEGNFTPDDARISTRLAALEMLKAGTTTFLETLVLGRHSLPKLCEVIVDTGLRAVLPRGVGDGGGYLDDAPLHPGLQEPPDVALDEAVAVAAEWKGSDRIRIWMGPRSTGGCVEDLLRRTVEIARSEGMGICHHYAMTDREIAYLKREFGATPTEYLERVGMLADDVVLAHCSGLPSDQAARLEGSGVSVIHCPTGPAKMGSGVTPVRELLDAGVNVGLGSDGGPANNTADLIRDFKWVAYLQKLRHHDPTVVPSESVLEMATIGGAKAIGMDDLIGSIEPGKRADMIVVRTEGPHWTPSLDPVSSLVYVGSGADVDTVIVNGQVLMEGRKMKFLDEDEILQEARDASERLYATTGLEAPRRWEVT